MWAPARARRFSTSTGTSKAAGRELDRGDRRRAEGCDARTRRRAPRRAALDPQRAQELAEGAAEAAQRGGGAAGAAARAQAAGRGGRGVPERRARGAGGGGGARARGAG